MYLMRPEGRNENIYLKSWYTYISWRFQSILVPFNMHPNSKRMRMRTHWRFRDLSHFSFGPIEKHEMWLLFFLSCLAFFFFSICAGERSIRFIAVCLSQCCHIHVCNILQAFDVNCAVSRRCHRQANFFLSHFHFVCLIEIIFQATQI